MHSAGPFLQPCSHNALPSRDPTSLLLHAVRRLVAFVFILALANLGTSFASAILAKDTTTSNGELVDIQTNEAVATAEAVKVFTVGADDGENARKLRCATTDINTNTADCDMATLSATTMSVANAQAMMIDCRNNRNVQLRYTGSDGGVTQKMICGPSVCTGSTFYNSGTNRATADLCIPGSSERILVRKSNSSMYTLSRDIFARATTTTTTTPPVMVDPTPSGGQMMPAVMECTVDNDCTSSANGRYCVGYVCVACKIDPVTQADTCTASGLSCGRPCCIPDYALSCSAEATRNNMCSYMLDPSYSGEPCFSTTTTTLATRA